MAKRKLNFWPIIWVAVGVLVLINIPPHFTVPLKGGTRSIALPGQALFASLGSRLRETSQTARGLGGIVARNNELSQEILRLRAKQKSTETLERQNRELRAQLAFYESSPFQMIPAEVIGRSISGWWYSVRINKGKKDGVQPDRAVITPNGLVGKTTEVNTHTSEILLISDPTCLISARISSSGAFAIVRGNGLDFRGNPLCRLDFVNRDIPIQLGDEVVTSGLGGVFPEGLVIGYIESIKKDKYGLYQEAVIVPKSDLSILDVLFVAAAQSHQPEASELTAFDASLKEEEE